MRSEIGVMNSTTWTRVLGAGMALVGALVGAIGSATGAAAIGEKAAADVKGRDGKELGTVSLVEATSGVLLRVKLKGLAPGAHGFHFHDAGKCEGDFASAGQIYNPLGAKHGFLNEEGPMSGDLPNLYASASGEVDVEIFSPFATLSKDAEEALLDANGATVVIFEKLDDYVSEPEGNSGQRIGCGALQSAK